MNNLVEKTLPFEVTILNKSKQDIGKLKLLQEEKNLFIYNFSVSLPETTLPDPQSIQFKFPALNGKGIWRPSADYNKRIEADWELQSQESRISIDAPIVSIFGDDDTNRFTLAASNTVNKINLKLKYREEDDCFYATLDLFSESNYPIDSFHLDIRLDLREIPFSKAIQETSKWWEEDYGHHPMPIPSAARQPLYSSWYQFHQELDESALIKECKIAKSLGFEVLIIDDGWQTLDNKRGYDYTGDWQNERFSDFKELVAKIHDIGMQVGLWFSVPFCGKKSAAYQKFKGKFLTENHRWAPVFDPRYPEVRNYLVHTFVTAVDQWDLDGLKLDFIDDFKAYPDTSFDPKGKDILSINEAVDMLLSEIKTELQKINPCIFIEFRQKYTGPSVKKYGNMLRAFDCPGDYTMNRVRIADIKLLSGETAVHSDMVTWHPKETLEVASYHFINTLFGVPQLSIWLHQTPTDQLEMIQHYTNYWKQNKAVLLSQNFTPHFPLENYPVQQAKYNDKCIIGLYANHFINLPSTVDKIDIINAKKSHEIVMISDALHQDFSYTTLNSTGQQIGEGQITIGDNGQVVKVPSGGMIQLDKK